MKRALRIIRDIMIVAVALLVIFGLNGCRQSDKVNYNIREDADNFKIRTRVIALNTRTNDALFEVEGLISIADDADGDLNVTIKTDEDNYKLFYAHLSKDVTYTCIQIDGKNEDPYAYNITFFPVREVIEHGLVNIKTTD